MPAAPALVSDRPTKQETKDQMTLNATYQTQQKERRRALLRRLVARSQSRLGRLRGNPFRRLVQRLVLARRNIGFDARIAHSEFLSLPSCLLILTSLGLGLAGGGGGSPGETTSTDYRNKLNFIG